MSSPTSSFERRRICRSLRASSASALSDPRARRKETNACSRSSLGAGVAAALQLGGRPAEEHLAVGEDEDAIGVALGLGDVVRAEDDGRAALGERGDEAPQPLALARVERARRLVEQQHRRVGEQADGDVHALAVAARQAAELVVGALAQARLVEHPLDGRVDVGDLLELGEQAQVLGDGELGVDRGLLRDPADPRRRPRRLRDRCRSRTSRIPASIVSSVVLPAPLGPMIASSSPRATSKLTSRTAWRSPKCLLTSLTVRAGAAAARRRPWSLANRLGQRVQRQLQRGVRAAVASAR